MARRGMLVARLALAGLVVGSLLGALGCGSGSGGRRAASTPVDFRYEADLFHESYIDTFLWDNPCDAAWVEVSALDLDGDLRLVVYDHLGFVVYDVLYHGFGGNILDIEEPTFAGHPGPWTVEIEAIHLSGEFTIGLFPLD